MTIAEQTVLKLIFKKAARCFIDVFIPSLLKKRKKNKTKKPSARLPRSLQVHTLFTSSVLTSKATDLDVTVVKPSANRLAGRNWVRNLVPVLSQSTFFKKAQWVV